MTRAELRAEVRRYLDDTTSQFVSDSDINDSLNEGYEDISEETEWYERTFNLDVLSYRNYYNIRELVSEDPIRVSRCFNTVTEEWLEPDSTRNLDAQIRQWELNTGEPESYIIHGHWWMGVWPKPAGDGVSRIRVYYTAMPPLMDEDADEPGFPDEFHRGLVDYALYDIYSQDRSSDNGLAYYYRYVQAASELAAYAGKRQSVDRAPSLKSL